MKQHSITYYSVLKSTDLPHDIGFADSQIVATLCLFYIQETSLKGEDQRDNV